MFRGVLLLAATLGNVSVTNHLGHVMTGELTSVTNGNFTISGRTMPLKVLPKHEQRRLKALAGADLRSARERLDARFLDQQLRIIDLREKAGEITAERAAELRAAARAAAMSPATGTGLPGAGEGGAR